MNFRTRISTSGSVGAGFEVPVDIIDALGAGKEPHVRITIKGHSYSDCVAMTGDRFVVALDQSAREAAGVDDGELVDVTIEWDDEPPDLSRRDIRRLHRNPG